MAEHLSYEVNGKHFDGIVEAAGEQSRVFSETGSYPKIVEHFKNGAWRVIPRVVRRDAKVYYLDGGYHDSSED